MKTTVKSLRVALWALFAALVTVGPVGAQQKNGKVMSLTVTNKRDVPATVYLEQGQYDVRLGTVGPKDIQVLELPPFLGPGEEVEVFVHPEKGEDLASHMFSVVPGADEEVLIPANDVGRVAPAPPDPVPVPKKGETTLTVENERSVTATVFVDEGSYDVRIGTVPAKAERTLVIPQWLVDREPTAEIFIHPEGGVDLGSQTFHLKPDEDFLLKVPAKR